MFAFIICIVLFARLVCIRLLSRDIVAPSLLYYSFLFLFVETRNTCCHGYKVFKHSNNTDAHRKLSMIGCIQKFQINKINNGI